MLLRRLWEIQQEQERQAAAAGEAAAAAAGMEVEGEEAAVPPAPREQRAGVVQKELVEWYMQKQLERCDGWQHKAAALCNMHQLSAAANVCYSADAGVAVMRGCIPWFPVGLTAAVWL
jgi:hypothetical protein